MHIHSMRIAAIGPFAGAHTINFAELGAGGIFLLEGPTGAGKSTIIDAIVFALYGKVADIVGRKRVLLWGLGLFGLGSALSGFSQSMPQLIAASGAVVALRDCTFVRVLSHRGIIRALFTVQFPEQLHHG